MARSYIWCADWGSCNNIADIEDIAVDTRNGTPIRIRDIGTVIIGHAVRLGRVGRTAGDGGKDEDDVPEGIIVMRRGENPLEVCERIEKMADEINRALSSPGVRLVTYYDRTGADRAHPAHRAPQYDRRHRPGVAGADPVSWAGQLALGAGGGAGGAVCAAGRFHVAGFARHSRQPDFDGRD